MRNAFRLKSERSLAMTVTQNRIHIQNFSTEAFPIGAWGPRHSPPPFTEPFPFGTLQKIQPRAIEIDVQSKTYLFVIYK